MNRSIWITAAAIYCFANGAIALISLSSVNSIAILQNPTHPFVLIDATSFCWAVLTGIGLERRWRWSRISIQIFAALAVYIGVISAFGTGVSTALHISNGVNALLGITWLVVFNLRQVKMAFTSTD